MKQFKQVLIVTLMIPLFLGACAQIPTARQTLTVYAAASLTNAFMDIGKAFEVEHPNVNVIFNFGGSQNLRTQIEQGAHVDIFASANPIEMSTLVREQIIDANVPKVFLTNRLIVVLPEDNPARIVSLADLSRPGLKIALAAEEVPAGRYARQVLDNLTAFFGADYKDKVLANVVSNEDNIRQAVTKVQLGEVDTSIVYSSDAVAVPELKIIEIPADVNVIAEYLMAPLINSSNMDLANEFIAYVLSSDGQATLEKWGFTPVMP